MCHVSHHAKCYVRHYVRFVESHLQPQRNRLRGPDFTYIPAVVVTITIHALMSAVCSSLTQKRDPRYLNVQTFVIPGIVFEICCTYLHLPVPAFPQLFWHSACLRYYLAKLLSSRLACTMHDGVCLTVLSRFLFGTFVSIAFCKHMFMRVRHSLMCVLESGFSYVSLYCISLLNVFE